MPPSLSTVSPSSLAGSTPLDISPLSTSSLSFLTFLPLCCPPFALLFSRHLPLVFSLFPPHACPFTPHSLSFIYLCVLCVCMYTYIDIDI